MEKDHETGIGRLQAAIENYPEASNLDKARQALEQLRVLLQAEIERQERIKALKEKISLMTQPELQAELHVFINSWLHDMKNDRDTASYWHTYASASVLYSLQSWEILLPVRYFPSINEIAILISSSTKGGSPIRRRWKVLISRNDDMEWKILSFAQ